MYVSSQYLPAAIRPDPPVHSIRVLYMPPIYAIISFFSYRFFRSYTYYSLIEIGALYPLLSETHPDPLHSIRGMSGLVHFSQTYGTHDYIRL
jgi:hypothetical protein